MYADVVTVIVAFFEGLALIISPCILPILPIILSGSLTGQKARPLGIITGFILTFTVVTLFSRALIELTHVNEDVIRNVSLVILFILSVIMLSTYLTEKFTLLTQRLANVGGTMQSANNPQSGFWGGILFGGLVGIIWTPCAGPILAAVIVQVVIQQTTFTGVLVVIAFAIGAGLPMLFIALLGRQFINTFGFLRERTVLIRKLLGLIILFTVIYLAFFSTSLLSFSQKNASRLTTTPVSLIDGIEKPYKVPDLVGLDAWINSPPLQWSDLKGKVVLIDFWTYSCINCIRTLPYLKDWYAKYHDQGFEIIGVHSPEFQFEHDLNNVKNAVVKEGILYPVALDNEFKTWRNFHNEYWPAHYLINKKGDVVYVHFGEGEYDVTENNIRYLLGLKGPMIENNVAESYSTSQTPETYFGYDRGERFSSPDVISKNQAMTYSYPTQLSAHHWALQGKWNVYPDKIVAANAGASLRFHFIAKNVYAVMGAPAHPVNVKLTLDGKPITTDNGSDVKNSLIKVSSQQLYALIQLKNGDAGTVEMTAESPGLEIYTFTFGD